MSDDAAFLHAITAHPAEDGPRLVYADWLDERGDPRGEFIRVQCELATLDANDARRKDLSRRERQLLKKHGAGWSAPIRGHASNFGFRRGFLAWAILYGSRLDNFHEPPPLLNDITFEGGFDRLTYLIACPLAAQLERLTLALDQPELDPDELMRTMVPRIEEEYAPLIEVEPTCLPRMRSLTLTYLGLDWPTLHALAAAPIFSQLDELNMRGQRLSAQFVQALASHSRLRRLRVNGCRLTVKDAATLVDPRQEWRPAVVEMSENAFGGQAGTPRFLDLLTGPNSPLAEVESLDLSVNRFTSREQRRLRQHFGARVIL